MTEYQHRFFIPVMGTGFTADTPVRLAPFGITSVVSLVDDLLLERLREHYSKQYNFPYEKIERYADDGRAKRVKAYMDMLADIIEVDFAKIKNSLLSKSEEKQKYFDLLPKDNSLRKLYEEFKATDDENRQQEIEATLNKQMVPGTADVNIMVKLDTPSYDKEGNVLGDEYTTAKAALRGFAESKISAGIVFSAGMNPPLFTYLSKFKDFYRDKAGEFKKKIILKVSDFRSAMIQGKMLAKNGLEVAEFRIESGLNCGGHAFPTQGNILPAVLAEFKEKKQQLDEALRKLVSKYYTKNNPDMLDAVQKHKPMLAVQGGIGTSGEVERLIKDYDVDSVGIGSPYMLVPEAVAINDYTRNLLANAKEDDLYLSDVSPLNIDFNNVKGSSADVWSKKRADEGKPGAPCVKGFACLDTEFTEKPICLSSSQYQSKKLKALEDEGKLTKELHDKICRKSCICHQLGNATLISLGLEDEENAPQAVCPGPNLAWFDRIYSLTEMVKHFYGEIKSLVPENRPHMFAHEVKMYVDYFKKMVDSAKKGEESLKKVEKFKTVLLENIKDCFKFKDVKPYASENLESLVAAVTKYADEVDNLYNGLVADGVSLSD